MTPVTQADVSRVSDGLGADPANARSLRAEAYTEDRWFTADQQAILARTWQWVCHVE